MAKDLRALYLTSFSPDLFAASGRRLLESYNKIGSPDRLLVCHEGVHGLEEAYGVESYDLERDSFLKDWLEANKAFIPAHLGGTLQPCKCPKRKERHAKHEPGCVQDWMRRNASRWFRKVASWRRAAGESKVDVIFWVDADCVFHREMPHEKLLSYFGGASMFYFRAHRPAPETGLLGFDLRKEGRAIIKTICDFYTSGDYRKEKRWDDGWIVGRVIDQKRFKTADVTPGKRPSNHVVTYSDIVQYVSHDKGRHGTQLNIMV